MPHEFGRITLPVPVPGAGESVSDPGLDVVADYLRAFLTDSLSDAWEAVAPKEPFVRSLFKIDPERVDEFMAKDLPALYIWRAQTRGVDDGTSHHTDGHETSLSTIRILWIQPLAANDKPVIRDPIFNGFGAAMRSAIHHGRDPVYVKTGDTSVSALTYGTDVLKAAGIQRWSIGSVDRTAVDTREGAYPALIADVSVQETSRTDPLRYRVFPNRTEFTITTGGSSPLTTQHEIEPDP